MLTSVRSILAASIFATTAAISAPALAQVTNPADEVSEDSGIGIEFSANAAIVSEYRFRGVDLSGGDIAIQGGIDLGLPAGFYVGTWGSSIDEDTVGYGHTELDVYGGWSGEFGLISTDVGVIAYIYPNAGAGEFDYVEFYGSVGAGLGPAEVTLGVAYAPSQDSLDFGGGEDDNLYLYTDVGVGIGPVTVTGHLGWTDGVLTYTDDGEAFDYSVGAEAAVPGTPLSVAIAYVGAEGDYGFGDYEFTEDTVVLTLSASF